jgi:hypothetical protein
MKTNRPYLAVEATPTKPPEHLHPTNHYEILNPLPKLSQLNQFKGL